MIHLAYVEMCSILAPLIIGALVWRLKWYKPVQYRYAFAETFKRIHKVVGNYQKQTLCLVRGLVLLLLMLLVSRPQLVDEQSKVLVEGIDIALVIDVSGSMQVQDFQDDDRSRIDVAKAEAARFVQKREDDSIGLVVFARDAVTRCPVTLDHALLRDIIYELQIGTIDPDRTMLAMGMVAGVNRLKASTAKSKVMILLTDGEPSEEDMDMGRAIEAARAFGIKVYTIGIGNEEDRLYMHPFYGPVRAPKVNKELLVRIAQQTGGRYFHVKSAHDMRMMYDVIDELERSSREHKKFKRYHELVAYFGLAAFCLFSVEIILSTFAWFAL